MKTTRRQFVKLSALELAAATSVKSFGIPGEDRSGASGQIRVWITDANHHFTSAPPISWRPASPKVSEQAISLNADTRFQQILGFGAALTDAACYVLNQLSSASREQLFHELFHPSQMGLNVCRTCVGASDYSTRVYSYDEGDPDPELTHFSIDHDGEYILPILRQARQQNPDLFLFSSPWSPPGWMKSSGSMLGGSMRRHYLRQYAQYFSKFLDAYAAAGVPIQAVTPQNEVDTDQDGRMPACLWPQEYEIEFVSKYLGPLLREKHPGTAVWILDHNYNLWGRVICELDDPKLRQYAKAVAWHGYVGEPEMMSKVHDAHPDAEMHWTEGGPDYTSPDYLTDWANWGQTFTAALRNWCQSITAWNLALDEHGKPNIGPFSCGGTLTIHSQTKEITRSGQYWALAHFSRVIRRGAQRFDSRSSLPDLDHIAVQNPDGSKVLVVTNRGASRTVAIQIAGMAAEVAMKQDSMATLGWT
jgi:glucosylceramidase